MFEPSLSLLLESMTLVNSKDEFRDKEHGHFSTSQPMKIHVTIMKILTNFVISGPNYFI